MACSPAKTARSAGRLRRSSHRFHLSVTADGWAAPCPELRWGWAQGLEGDGEPLFRIYGTGEVCSWELDVGEDAANLIADEISCDVPRFGESLRRLGVEPALAYDSPGYGIVMTSTRSPRGERFVRLLNLDGFDQRLRPTDGGAALFPGREFSTRRAQGDAAVQRRRRTGAGRAGDRGDPRQRVGFDHPSPHAVERRDRHRERVPGRRE